MAFEKIRKVDQKQKRRLLKRSTLNEEQNNVKNKIFKIAKSRNQKSKDFLTRSNSSKMKNIEYSRGGGGALYRWNEHVFFTAIAQIFAKIVV